MKLFYNYPYKETPVNIIGEKLLIILSKNNYKFSHVTLNKDKFFFKIFGRFVGSFLVYQSSQLFNLIKFRENSKNWYFDFFFK